MKGKDTVESPVRQANRQPRIVALDLAIVDRRILLLVTDLKIGGTPTVVRELALRLSREKNVAVHVACLDEWGPVADQLKAAGVAVTALNACCAGDIRVLFRLAKLIRDQRIDTVFSFLIHANAAAAVVRIRFPNIRFFQSIQTTQPEPRWHWWVQRICQHGAEKIVVPSPSVAEAAEKWAGVSREKIVVIPNAVDPIFPSPGTPGEGQGEGLSEGDAQRSSPLPAYDSTELAEVGERGKKVGFIGRLDPVKRVGDLIISLTLLDSDVTLHIFGEGEEREVIQKEIRRLNLGNRVVLHGSMPNPWVALAGLDVLVLPSLAEGFGLVLIEAMAAGVPVVATDVAGIRDVVIHEENGLLVPAKNPEALAGAIGRILSDAALRDRLIVRGRETVLERFTWQRIYAEYRALLM